MRRITACLLVFALGLALAAYLARPGASLTTSGTLSASVGPGFSISMSASTVVAGSYTINVSDQSSVHNFHLSGPGVNESTDIAGTGSTSWSVVLQPGSYHFQCDAHASTMNGTLTVTSGTTTTTTSSSTTTTTTPTTTTTAHTTTSTPPPSTSTTTETAPASTATTTVATPTTTAETTTAETTTTVATTPAVRPLHARIGALTVTAASVRVVISATRPGHATVGLFAGSKRLAHASVALGASARAITLRPAHRLPAGRYSVRLRVVSGGTTAVATKTFRR
jgi:hypothetical protein